MHIVLFEPEIPPNTGNIARLCAATAVPLHLIEPLGFKLEDRYLKRAGLDYWPHVQLAVWPNFAAYRAANPAQRLVCTSAKKPEHGPEPSPVHRFVYTEEDALIFGPETRGLPQEILSLTPHRVRIPTKEGTVRSLNLNLSTSAGIVLYAALAYVGGLENW